MAKGAMSGRMAVTMRVNSSTACSKVKVSRRAANSEGVYFFAESEKTYEGQFAANVFEGYGRLAFKDGRRYEGNFKAGKKHGQGTMVFPNGNKYIGEWAQDL